MIARAFLAVTLIATLAGEARAAAPAWLREAAAVPSASGATATVLLDHIDITVSADGRVRTVRRYAVRISSRDGRDAAVLREVYITGSGRIRGVRGWILDDGRTERDLGDRHILDLASVGNDIYNEVRVRALVATEEVTDGDVFGAEIESEERLLYAQFEWPLQDRWPVALARRSVAMPADWVARSVTFNGADIQPRRDAGATIWEVRNLPQLPEDAGLPAAAIAPRLAVSLFGSERSQPAGAFGSWKDVATWLDGLSAGVARPTDTVAQRARQITAGVTGQFERIAAIGRFAQQVQYVSIQTGLGRGGGYQPRPPATVLERNYGDCKDKAALMRAMLDAIGIKSYLVTLYSGDPNYVRREWPSPQQFNHAIIAISVGEDITAPGVLVHPTLGRLLIFDPTDAYTPVGEIPADEQGSLALIVSPLADDVAVLPVQTINRPLIERNIELTIATGGTLAASVQERLRGEAASNERARSSLLTPADYRVLMERRALASAPGGKMSDLRTEDGGAEFFLAFRVEAPMSSAGAAGLLVIEPPFSGDRTPLPAATSTFPVWLERTFVSERARLILPAGYVVDERPGPISLETPFGKYALMYEVSGASVVATRTLQLTRMMVPAADVAALRRFLEAVQSNDSLPIVLARK